MDQHGSPGNVIRWLLVAAVFGAMAWTAPDYLAAEQRSMVLEVASIGVTLLIGLLAVLLVRQRHGTTRERLPLALGIVGAMLLQGAIGVGFSEKALLVLALWAMYSWVEWRRVDMAQPARTA